MWLVFLGWLAVVVADQRRRARAGTSGRCRGRSRTLFALWFALEANAMRRWTLLAARLALRRHRDRRRPGRRRAPLLRRSARMRPARRVARAVQRRPRMRSRRDAQGEPSSASSRSRGTGVGDASRSSTTARATCTRPPRLSSARRASGAIDDAIVVTADPDVVRAGRPHRAARRRRLRRLPARARRACPA